MAKTVFFSFHYQRDIMRAQVVKQHHITKALADSLLSLARHLRINQQTPTEIKLDDTKAIENMALRGTNIGIDLFVAVRSRFLDGFNALDWRLDQVFKMTQSQTR